jgi:hypothetical protein
MEVRSSGNQTSGKKSASRITMKGADVRAKANLKLPAFSTLVCHHEQCS